MKENKRALGTKFEKEAGAYLESLGYEILEYNFRCRSGEIDIIARDKEYLVFCEVKYRNGPLSGHPLEAVDVKKQKTIIRCAGVYLSQNGYLNVPCRFDVIGITKEKTWHIQNAFEAY
ncbi:MAG: YraN family protein [Lachnospiraceae bacterium]|nr:YraN family protein [Lachnospiraceae bacterium]